jgi:glycosyltransferase involved in cell wall biosynthesis
MMHLAILGTRGIPANYGGFETFAEELSKRLVLRGHDVTVYCRSHHVDRELTEYEGVHLKTLPTLKHKYLDTVVHTFFSAISAAPRRFDAVLICNAANSPFIPILTLTGTPVAVNVDGLERKRKKWNWLGRAYYRLGERTSVWFATEVITDARVIHDYYSSVYGAETTMIAYGAEVVRRTDLDAVAKYGVSPDGYFLYVSRLEPENNAAIVIEAFRKVLTDLKLVIVGDAPYASEYKARLRSLAEGDPRIIFTGFVFGSDYKSLQQNAYAYIHATEVGGTHPALIEAMGYGNCVLAYETPENVEVIGDAAMLFKDGHELAEKLQKVADDRSLVDRYRTRAQDHVRREYSWDSITDKYEELFTKMTAARNKL